MNIQPLLEATGTRLNGARPQTEAEKDLAFYATLLSVSANVASLRAVRRYLDSLAYASDFMEAKREITTEQTRATGSNLFTSVLSDRGYFL